GEDRPHALATAEDRVAHGLVDRGGRRAGGRELRVERAVDLRAPLGQVVGERHSSSSTPSASSSASSNGSTRGCPFASARISSIFFSTSSSFWLQKRERRIPSSKSCSDSSSGSSSDSRRCT